MSIKVENVIKLYGKQKALDNVSFNIDTGQIVGFIGPNGAGKSTMMKIITGYLKPTSGKVWINGLNIEDNSLEIKRLIGYLPENAPLYYDMYVREFLDFTAGIYGLKQRKKLIDKIIEMTGLEIEQHKKIGQLSKGYKQRVSLAQAIIHDPQVLILDEPTTGLDPNQIVQIRDLILELGKEKTVMLSTHIMQEVEAICDRIIIINKGKIVADDTPETIDNLINQEYMTFIVEFDTPLTKEQINTIDDLISVKAINEKHWVLNSHSDIRRRIFEFAVKNNIAVLSMQMQKKSLEEIFQYLTNNEKK